MDDQTKVIDDHVVAGRIIPALIGIRAELKCCIPEAIDEFQRRYDRLRAERGGEFTLSVEEYGRGFYS